MRQNRRPRFYIQFMLAFILLAIAAARMPAEAAGVAGTAGTGTVAGAVTGTGAGTGGAADVAEVPNVKIVINGVPGVYSDVALEINNRIMLPFREILTKLGVTNDDEHIVWNDDEESITVYDGPNIVKLQIGNSYMSVNGMETKFDAAPYFYANNNRSYVPVRAISELLDKQIMWEESTSTVYIRDKTNYAETLALLEKMRDAKKMTKIQALSESALNLRISSESAPLPGAGEDGVLRASMEMSQMLLSDLDNNIMHIKQLTGIDGVNIGSEMFFYKNRVFMKMEAPGFEWRDAADLGIDISAPVDQIMLLESQMDARPLEDIAMGFAAVKNSDGTYTITGEPLSIAEFNMIPDMIAQVLPQDNVSDFEMDFKKMQIGTTLDSEYAPLKAVVSIDFDFSISRKTANGNIVTVDFGADMYITINYYRTGPDFTVPIPDGVMDLLK